MRNGKNREMDTWIDKVVDIWMSFMQDIDNSQWKESSFVYDRCNIFYVAMLRIVTNHIFISIENPFNECVDTFSVLQLWVLLTISGSKCLMHFRPTSVLVGYL